MFHITFAEVFSEDYTDWTSREPGGFDYSSYFISGYKVLGEGDKKFQSNYVTVNYGDGKAIHDNESAWFSGMWTWSANSDTNKWTTEQQLVKPKSGKSNWRYDTRRLKVRGSGPALQFKVRSEASKPFYINGWTVLVTGNTQP